MKFAVKVLVLQFILVFSAFAQSFEIESAITRVGYYPLRNYTPLGEVHELRGRQIENQQQSEECFLFAFTNFLQVANVNSFAHNPAPNLSGPYSFVVKLLDFIDQSFSGSEPYFSLEGGNIPDAIEISTHYGIVPEVAWRPLVPFYQWPFEDLYRNLKKTIHADLKELDKLQKKFGADSESVISIRQKMIQECKEMVLQLSGPLPESFSWNGQSKTPVQFSQEFGIAQARNFRLLLPPKQKLYDDESIVRSQMRKSIGSFHGRFSIEHSNWAELESKMRAAIDHGMPVLVSLYWNYGGSHVLTAVGYEVRDGRVYTWKFLNSWGRWTPDGEAYFKASDIREKAEEIWLIR